MSTHLTTDRLIIRSFRAEDAQAWVAMIADPQVRRYLPNSEPPTVASFEESFSKRQATEAQVGYAIWAVDERATGMLVGQCGIRLIHEGRDPETELAYHYGPAVWNKGYGTEAAAAVLAHAFSHLGVDRVIAVAMAENIGSWRVMEKAGMRLEDDQASYFGLVGLRKYAAERVWWEPARAS